VTEKNRAATAALRSGAYDRAAALYRESDAMAPNGSAVYGLCNAYLSIKRYDSVLAVTRRVLDDPRRAPSMLPLWLWRGDAARGAGDRALAASCYRTLAEARPGGWTEDDAREKLAALSSPRRVQDLLLRFFDLQGRPGVKADTLRDAGTALLREAFAADSTVPVTRLLLARNLAFDSSRQSEAVLLFSGMRTGDFFYECSMQAGELLFRSGALDAAERQYSRALAASATEMQRLEARESLERIAWKHARRVRPGNAR
jgi:tetratricopeptide (TPR) repeat protein